jgi:hypothetical protein
VTEEKEDEEEEHDSPYVARMTVGSPDEVDYARRLISERTDDTDATIRPSMMATGHTEETLRPEQTNDSDTTIRPYAIATDDSARTICTGVPETDENAETSDPNVPAKKHGSSRRAAICNATRISDRKHWKGLDLWKFRGRRSPEARSDSNDREEPLLASPRKATGLPANPSKSDLDGLAKLIGSIDSERVNTVRHIWHEETHEWTHERTAGPSSS